MTTEPSSGLSEMTEVRSAGELGLGLVATVDIGKGTRILSESPLVRRHPTSRPLAQIRRLIQQLGDRVSKLDALTYNPSLLDPGQPNNLIYQLSKEEETWDDEDESEDESEGGQGDCEDHSEDESKGDASDDGMSDGDEEEEDGSDEEMDDDDMDIEAIETLFTRLAKFFTNSTELMSRGKDVGSGLFPEFARINHSCVPNAYSAWNEIIGQQTVHAGRDIQAGEQIFISYLGRTGAFLTRDERNQTLRGRWGFDCVCAHCVDSDSVDILRGQMAALEQDLAKLSETCTTAFPNRDIYEPAAREGIDKAEALVGLMENAGLGGWKIVEIYDDVCHFHLLLKGYPKVIDCYKKILGTQRTILGADAVDEEAVRDVAALLPSDFKQAMLSLLDH